MTTLELRYHLPSPRNRFHGYVSLPHHPPLPLAPPLAPCRCSGHLHSLPFLHQSKIISFLRSLHSLFPLPRIFFSFIFSFGQSYFLFIFTHFLAHAQILDCFIQIIYDISFPKIFQYIFLTYKCNYNTTISYLKYQLFP